jgi:ABC-type multidrug transport system fused ATPase/permease subunit
MNHKSALDGTSETEGRPLRVECGDVEFKNVSFAHPSRPDQHVIKNLSMSCLAGKHTAIVGLSGSGKSTVASLIARLYVPETGIISLDGQNIKDVNLRQLRSFINLVQQEPSLLDRSILENIALGLVNSPSKNYAHLIVRIFSYFLLFSRISRE